MTRCQGAGEGEGGIVLGCRGKGDSPSYFYLGENRAGQSQEQLQVTSPGLQVCLQAWLVPSHRGRLRAPTSLPALPATSLWVSRGPPHRAQLPPLTSHPCSETLPAACG